MECKTCKHKKGIGSFIGCNGICDTSCDEPAKPKLTNFQRITASHEMLASVLTPLMPTMEGFCSSGRHWKDGACDVNPNWKCEECMADWLGAPADIK